MRARLTQLWDSLWPDPQRTGLSGWLVAIHLLLVLLVGGGISWYASGLLHALADEQGKVRVQLAATLAREDLRRMGEDAHTLARSLAERPTLQRLLAQGRREELPPLLRRACEAGGTDACALLSGHTVLAVSGPALDWQQIATAAAEQGGTFLTPATGEHVPVLGAHAGLPLPDTEVYVVRRMDEKLARALSERAGVQIRLADYRSYASGGVNPYTPLYAAALADGRLAVQRVDSQDVYAAGVPVSAASGEAIALVEAVLPTSAVDTSARHLIRKMLVTALILAALAVFAGVILAEWVARPVRALTQAAARLAGGDFSASIPTGGAAEVGVLARTMEDMRRSLIDLTGTLRRREAEAQAVLSGIVEGVYAVDRNRLIRYLNPQAARLLGVSAEQAIGRFCGDVLKPQDEDGRRPCDFRCPILRARSEGSAQAVERLQAAGEPRTTVITSATGVEGLQVQVMRDETELEAVRRARDSVLANISHEFRTPLAAQLASIELLSEGLDTLPADQRRELVTSLERGTLRLTQLIDNLLESVRIESGQLAIRHQQVALAEVVADAGALIAALLRQRGQQLQVSIPDELPLLAADKTRLTQVFVNLLANSNKFAPEGSVIRVGAAAHDGRLLTWVEDEGAGPAPGSGTDLFARFRRGGGEPEPAGLGLGLWLVRSIVERHGGTVHFERTAEDRTRFTLTLPTMSAS